MIYGNIVKIRSDIMTLVNFIRGFFMAMADSVPGVSGGTIAFVLGFYEKFIVSLNNVVSKDKEKRKEAIIFLLKIGGGWITGIVLSILFIASNFESHIYEISSLFLGLIILSIPFIINEEKETLRDNIKHIYFVVIGFAVVFLITYFNPLTEGNIVSGHFSDITLMFAISVIIAGMIGISAMVLPGISGSTILLIMGLYGTIIGSVKEIFSFNFGYLPTVFLFGIGVIGGILLTIPLVKKAITKKRSQTMYVIIGLMLGSIYSVIMGPRTLEIPREPLNIWSFSIIYFIIGGLLIVGLNYLKVYFEKRQFD